MDVDPCGLFVAREYPFLAATPDGLVGEDSVVEVKCPYGGRGDQVEATKKFPFLTAKGTTLGLNSSHKYYDQVQGQMFVTGRTSCYFVVYTFVDMKYFKIEYDEEYCKQAMLPRLQCFYEKKYLPFLAKALYA